MSKVITIAQQKGGSGKTTIAAQLAVAFAYKGKKTIVVDIDPQGSLTQWFTLRKEFFGEGNTKIDSIPFAGWKASSEIDKLKNSYDIIIVDSPPHTETETKTVIRAADLVIIPIQPSPTDLWASKATIEFAKSENKQILLLLNRTLPHSKIAKEIVSHLPDLPTISLGQRVVFATSMMDGRSVIEVEPSGPGSIELNEIVKKSLLLLKK
ncbi:MAG: ParA family partition ATPase [Alphaproteobacteria bacterium]